MVVAQVVIAPKPHSHSQSVPTPSLSALVERVRLPLAEMSEHPALTPCSTMVGRMNLNLLEVAEEQDTREPVSLVVLVVAQAVTPTSVEPETPQAPPLLRETTEVTLAVTAVAVVVVQEPLALM